MAYKQRSSGLPFKEIGSSPAKQSPDFGKVDKEGNPIESTYTYDEKTDKYVKKEKKSDTQENLNKNIQKGITTE